MDQELITYLDQRFTAIDQRFTSLDQKIESLREETMQRFERVEDRIHQTQITVEALDGNLRLIAEAWVGFTEKQESNRGEIQQEFNELRATIRLPYEDLDRRIKVLETRARNEGRDPMEIVREVHARMSGRPLGPTGST
jgi:hypothetical protein